MRIRNIKTSLRIEQETRVKTRDTMEDLTPLESNNHGLRAGNERQIQKMNKFKGMEWELTEIPGKARHEVTSNTDLVRGRSGFGGRRWF